VTPRPARQRISRDELYAALSRRWADRIRAELKWAGGCGDPAHRVDTPFRQASKWPPVDECRLRDAARRQLEEAAQ
jgi:hypothetical protein